MHSLISLLNWIKKQNKSTYVKIKKIGPSECENWVFDSNIHRVDNSFFIIKGIKGKYEEQPILVQDEIGFLGLIAKIVDGELFFLMQAKIEPGNINCVQISPTIQATKSNFTQKHGGKKPLFLEFFLNPKSVLVDQLQSEQSSRFFKKRNRNMIVLTDENDKNIRESDKFKWISLSQLKKLMKIDNLVNMDTRTVLSCLPISFMSYSFKDACFEKSVQFTEIMDEITSIYKYINDYKMFNDDKYEICNLLDLKKWTLNCNEIVADYDASFKVCFCDITIEGREVKHWCQPLFEAISIATFGLIYCEDNGIYKFLVRAKPEIGCFDQIELGPTIQIDGINHINNDVEALFFQLYQNKESVMIDVLLSEEGGRFYHEQNKNVILKSNNKFSVPNGYFWVTYATLNYLVQINNCLNIQLRNLLCLLEFKYEKH